MMATRAQIKHPLVKAVLVDLSGTLHIEDNATPGAVAALKRFLTDASHLLETYCLYIYN